MIYLSLSLIIVILILIIISLNVKIKNTSNDVWDRGKGIPENDMPFIFNRLHTLEKSRNRKFQGSGLGLTISKKLAENQQGKQLL